MLPVLQHAARWTAQGVQVTLLDENRYLYYSGMVPEYLGGVYERDEIRVDLKRLCEVAGVHFVWTSAKRLDPERRRVHTSDGTVYSYNLAAFNIGARNPGLEPAAIPTKPLHHIEALAKRLHETLTEPSAPLRLVVAGGGAAGVEIALNITSRFAAHGISQALELTIVEQAQRLLPSFPTGLSDYATELLEARGVNLQRSTTVTSVDRGATDLSDGRSLATDHVLWSTGSVGPPLFDDAGLICDDRGFARVTNTLQCMSFPRLFAAGDCATVARYESLRKVGVHAVKQGSVLRTNLDRTLSAIRAGLPPHEWTLDTFTPYPTAPLILSTGTPEGIWTAGPVWLHGRPFLRLKHLVDRRWIRRYHPQWQHAHPLRFVDAAAAHS